MLQLAIHLSTLCMGMRPVDILCGTPQQDILCGTPQQDILCGTPQQDNISHSEYVAKVQKGLGDVFDKVWEKTGQSQV